MNTPLTTLTLATRNGEFIARYSAKGLASLNFPKKGNADQDALQRVPTVVRGWHRLTTRAVNATLAGKDADELPPLDLSAGTDFQRAVWAAMRKIRAGQTRSYGEIARDIGKPKAVRAVGAANGRNPIPIVVPCHRVIGAGGSLVGFGGGLPWKRLLLDLEAKHAQRIRQATA